MPYILQKKRKAFLPYIENLIEELDTQGDGNYAGNVNFIISTILWRKFSQNKCYSMLNTLIGVLECAKLELYRRHGGILENVKINENGDLQ